MTIRALILCLVLSPACVYRLGGGLTAGILDEAAGEGRTEGVEGVTRRIVEREVLAELGRQLGEGLRSGATDITPEQQAHLEAAIDSAMTRLATSTGDGLREEVSPELRAIVRDDIVGALAEGMRGELGDSLEETVDRVVARAVYSLERGISHPDFRLAISEALRDAVYRALREGRPGRPGVGEALETTLTDNLLVPFEASIGGLADTVADRVDESARRTERTLQAIITALAVGLGILALLYVVRGRQLMKERTAHQELRTVEAVLDRLDPEARADVLRRLEKPAGGRSTDYVRTKE